MSSIFRRLNVSPLTSLLLSFENIEGEKYAPKLHGLQVLRNIRDFDSGDVTVTEDFIEFLQLNKDHMEELSFRMRTGRDTALQATLWTTVSQMAKLWQLNVVWKLGAETTFPRFSAGSLPMLELLNVTLEGSGITGFYEFLESLNGSKLRILEYTGHAFDLKDAIHESTKNLKELSLCPSNTGGFWYNLIPDIFMLKELTKLYVYHILDSDVLPLIRGLPNLKSLMTMTTLQPDTFIEVRRYLKESNRRFEMCLIDLG